MTYRIILIVLLIILGGCTQVDVIDMEENPIGNEMSIIVSNSPGKFKEYKRGKTGSYVPFVPKLRYIDDSGIINIFEFLNPDSVYAIHIKTFRPLVEIEIFNKAFDSYLYYLNPGDSLMIKYEPDRIASRKILNDNQSFFDVSDSLKRINNYEYSPANKLSAPIHFANLDFNRSPIENQKVIDDFIIKESKDAGENLNIQLSKIYYFFEEGYISKDEYFHRLNHIEYNLAKLGIKIENSTPIDYKLDVEPYQLYYDELVKNNIKKLGISYQRIKSSNGEIPDFRAILRELYEMNVDGTLKKRSIELALEQVIVYFSISDQREYIDKYLKVYGDQKFIDYLYDKYNLNYELQKDDLKLIGVDGEEVSLKNILSSIRSEIIYVDIWASWCKPCRASFKDSKAMQKKLSEYPISFLYLSIDQSNESWINAVEEDNLDQENCFRVLHSKTSKWLETYEVTTIPRYIIFDNKNNILHKKAIGPGKSCEELLKKVVEEKK